jgi:hypothetical protein
MPCETSAGALCACATAWHRQATNALLPRRSQLHAVLQLNCKLYYTQASCTVSSSTGCSYRKHRRYRPPCLHTPANEEYQMHKIRLISKWVPAATPAVTPAATDPGGLLHQQLSL